MSNSGWKLDASTLVLMHSCFSHAGPQQHSCVYVNMTYVYIPPGWKSRDSVPMLVEYYLAKKIKVDEFVSHTFPLTDINKAFEVMHQGER